VELQRGKKGVQREEAAVCIQARKNEKFSLGQNSNCGF